MSFFQSRKPFQCQIHTSCFHGRCFLTERQERDSNTKNTFDTTRNATLEDIHFVQLLLPKPHISFCWTSGCIFFLTQLRTVDFVPHHFKWKCFKRDFFVFGFDHKKQQRKKLFQCTFGFVSILLGQTWNMNLFFEVENNKTQSQRGAQTCT